MRGRSWGLGTGLGILKWDVGVRQETGRDTESRKEPQRASSEKEKDTWKSKQGCPVLLGTDTERDRGLGHRAGVAMSSDLPLQKSHRKPVFNRSLRAAKGAVIRHLHAVDAPVSPKETSEKFLSVGRERKGPWLWAQSVALGHGPVTGVRGPGYAAGNQPHQARDHHWGQGPVSKACHSERTHQNPLHPRWHTGALALRG